MNKSGILDRLQRKFGRYAVKNLMFYIAVGMGIVFILDYLPFLRTFGISAQRMLMFDRNAVLHGQIWRIITFVFCPTGGNVLFFVLSAYFYWMIGSALEQQWGSFRFNLFYLCGVVCTVIAGFITGGATNYYLNLSLFLAFALIYPDFEVNMFFLIPIKVKFLAILDMALLVFSFVTDTWSGRIAMLVALGNVALFFFDDFLTMLRNMKRRREFRQSLNGKR